MKNLFVFFAAFIIWSMQTVLATDVSGTISANTTWNAAGSPYVVTSSITIQTGVTLTIASGVTVKFNDNQYLYVYGTLNADNVVFTTSSATVAAGKWGYIQVGNGTYAGTANISNSQIQYAQKLHVEKGTATLTSTNISNCSTDGIYVTNSGILNMTNGNISGVTYSGITVNTGGVATLNGVGITNAKLSGISLNTGSAITINGCTVSLCDYPLSYNGSSSVTLSGVNSFTQNTHKYVDIHFYTLASDLTLPTFPIAIHFYSNFKVNEGKTLTIGSNNILKFQDNAALDIEGILIANANVGENIYFTSTRDDNWGGDTNNDGTITAPSSGNWYGVRFQNTSDDTKCLMRRCKVRYAGYNKTGGISMFNASPTIDDCDLSNNYFGVYMQYASNPIFTNNTIGSSKVTPIAMSYEANPTMSNNILSFSDNDYDAIGLIGGTLTANATLKIRSVTSVPNITYLIIDQIIVPLGKTLTINKGIVIKSFGTDYTYNPRRIIVEGTLTANAIADSMITFTSARDDNYGNPADCNKDGTITSPVVGDWGGIIFKPGSSGTINYCRIKYAKVESSTFTSCSVTEYLNETAVAMIDASPTISNCEFKDLTYGISCYRASNPVISNNNMINIQYTPFCISGSSNPTFIGNTFTNVGWRAIGLLGGNVCQNGTIKKRDVAGFTNITYVLLDDMIINSGTNVNVEPGIVIKVFDHRNSSPYKGCSIYIDGGFKTDGTSSQGVVFTSIKDDNEGNPFDSNGDGNASTPASSDWGSIKYRSTSDDAYCLLNNTTIKYAGNTNEGGVTFENAGGQFKNSIISNTSNYGVYCNGNTTSIVDNVTIQNCSLDPIAMSLKSNPSFTNITFVSNFSQAIKIIEGTLSSNATLATRDVAGITNIAYIIDKLVISTNAKLTIQPDVVIKFRADYGDAYILVNGNLMARGTASNKIYFTSFADDSKGGDSNNNGNASTPDKGDWGGRQASGFYGLPFGGIRIENNSMVADTVNSLKYCEISYASTGLRIINSHATIDNCIVQLAKYFGAVVIGSANPDFKNTQFYNINFSPIELSMFSNPTFTDCSALNVGYMALSVIQETYSQSATVPVRNFGGYTNITYFMEAPCTINSGTTITIPAGIIFKSSSYINNSNYNNYYNTSIANGFIVNGRLNIQGTSVNPVVFTNDKDDNYGNPLDMNQNGSASQPPDGISPSWSGNWLTFNDVSDDLSSIDNVVMKYGNIGIATLSASPVINHTRFENLYYGVDMNGVSAPKIDNCTFRNLQYYPMQISLVSYPASTLNNVISGTTYKVIKVKDETLTQDVTLPKRDFGGVTNIPYYFEHYTIGTGATLTINPGIVCKFFDLRDGWSDSYYHGRLDIFKGLSAMGGASPDSNIVFTSIKDDFYGGDSNSDSTFTSATSDRWYGLIFEDQSLDPLCKLKNCIIRFARKGIQTVSASPTIENCNINNNYYGVYATAASNPVFSNCDFDNNFYFAIDNVDKSFVINAKNCWWGSNLGPIQTNIAGNGKSLQEIVTTSVDFTPWKTIGAGNPQMGDVSLNGKVQGYDASLVMQNVVGNISLNSIQQKVADVSGTSGITSYDASLISQYAVGLIQGFPAELKKANLSVTYPQLTIGSSTAINGQDVNIPLSVTNVSGMVSTDIKLKYDPAYLQIKQVEQIVSGMTMLFSNDSINGILTIAMAGIYSLKSDTILAQVTFRTMLPSGNAILNSLTVSKFLANESDMTSGVINGSITTTNNTTGISTDQEKMREGLISVFPNPSSGNPLLNYLLKGDKHQVNIEVVNLMGQKVVTLVNGTMDRGKYSIPISKQGSSLNYGVYFIRMTVDGISHSQKFLIVR